MNFEGRGGGGAGEGSLDFGCMGGLQFLAFSRSKINYYHKACARIGSFIDPTLLYGFITATKPRPELDCLSIQRLLFFLINVEDQINSPTPHLPVSHAGFKGVLEHKDYLVFFLPKHNMGFHGVL